MDMSTRYQQLHHFLVEASQNTTQFMEGKLMPFGPLSPIHRDVFFEELISSHPFHDKVECMLKIILPAMAKLVQHLYGDHLLSGKYSGISASSQLYHQTRMMPKHKFSESVLAYIDEPPRRKPNISIIACEAYSMFSQNKTMDWLNSKSHNELQHLLSTVQSASKCRIYSVSAIFK